MTWHVYSALVFVGSKVFFDKLPPADQQAFMAAAAQASAFGRNYVRSNEAKQLAELDAAGMQVVTNPDLAVRTGEVQYLVWDTYTAARTPFFAGKLQALVDRYHGSPVFLVPNGETASGSEPSPAVIIYQVRAP